MLLPIVVLSAVFGLHNSVTFQFDAAGSVNARLVDDMQQGKDVTP